MCGGYQDIYSVKALLRNYDARIKYFEYEETEMIDPIAKYCLKKISDTTYHIAIAALNDVIYEKSNITPIEAVKLVMGKIRKIREQCPGEKVFWSITVQI